jgi:TnpA family transposase
LVHDVEVTVTLRSRKRVSADGTQWDTYERNLLAERHIRYGGFGGVAFYHVSDLYMALFSRFIPCGAYEGVYILDPFHKNKSDIQPDTVHADTHGQRPRSSGSHMSSASS